MTLLCVGLSHKQAPIAVREQVAIAEEALPERLRAFRALPGVREVFVLSTCNRLEVFALAESRAVADDVLRAIGPEAAPHAVIRADAEAVRHLFRVTASLDSMVVGEAQIQGQVKEAAALAQGLGVMGAELTSAFMRAMTAAKRVRTETEVARGAVSLSSVAVELARKLLGDLSGKSVALLGAGEMAQLAARELKHDGARELLVANRSPQRADELAREVEGVPVPLAELPALLERVDVVLCSTGARKAVVTREAMEKAVKARRFRPVFLVDLSLPRNVEPSVNELENVYVYDLDDLEGVAARNREVRSGHVTKADAIVEEELQAFLAARHERRNVPVLGRLRAYAESVARAEVERTVGSLRLDERQEKSVRAMANAIVNKLLHTPTARLRAEAGEGPLADAAAQLFGLDEDPDEEKEPGLKIVSPR